MGFTPREVEEMSLWQFICCCEAHRQGDDSVDPPSAEEYRTMIERLG